MAYTSGIAMEERGLRDIERWRDKIEVRLDNRQVFFLFFGSALVACMLFVLGVIVGKRLESRGRAVSPEIEDPLALLDKVATSPRPAQTGVSFPQALFGANAKVPADKAAKKSSSASTGEAEAETAKPAQPGETAKPGTENKLATESKLAAAAEDKKDDKKPATAKVETKATVAAAEGKQDGKKPETASAKAKPVVVATAEKKDEKKPEPSPAKASKPAEAKEVKLAAIPTVAAGGESKTKGRFALQLSSFQDKAEAEAFAQKFSSERPYMVMSDIPGKGIWYRVRVGDFASAKDAMAAKDVFEKKHNVIAYVAQK